MNLFVADRKLLNPKFEGYKLDLEHDQIISRFPLKQKVSQSTSPSRSVLSFQEVQSKITHNHLTISTEGNRAVYVDEDYNVVSVVISDCQVPAFRIVYELPKPVQSNNIDIHPEYPSSVFLSNDILAVSDGHGYLYLLRQNDGGPSQLLGTYQSPIPSPFRIYSGNLQSPDAAIILFSSRNYESRHSISQKKEGPSVEFEIWTARLHLPDSESSGRSDDVKAMEILWRREGEEPPIFTTYDPSSSSFAIIGGSVYHEHGDAKPYTPAPDEIAPIPRANENLDENYQSFTANVATKPHPYSWTQSSDSVTVAFPLPSTTQKTQIHVQLTSETLSLSFDGVQNLVPLPKYSSKSFWDRIQSSTSYWTWDREAENAFGLLTLHLDKQNVGTKWMQVFASAGTIIAAEASLEDVEVPETLDPSELWHIRESLEKYTAALRDSGLGLGKGVPSLTEGEMDEEVDASVGRRAFLSWFGREDGSRPSWAPTGKEQVFQLLSLPVPGGHDTSLSLIVKEGLDGVVYTLRTLGEEPKWVHTSTFSALAFVLASKRDIRFTFHSRDAVYALENGSLNGGGNAYIYRSASRGEKWAKQAILRVSEGSGGVLLGIGALTVDGTKRVLLCLEEHELILLNL